MELVGSVYLITNLINHKKYIGQTSYDPAIKRWSIHKTLSKKRNSLLGRAIFTYGAQNFKFEVILSCFDLEELEKQEQYFIKFYNTETPNGYNCEIGGRFSTKQSEETRQKKSLSQQRALKRDPSLKERRLKGLKNYWETATQINLQERSNKIKKSWTVERRKKNSKLHKGKKKCNKAAILAIIRPIEVVNQNEILKFDSISIACRQLNLTTSAVVECLKGRRKTHKGYSYRYLG